MKNRILIQTGDGSHTLYRPDLDEHYHSIHGAVQESQHVFIKNGFLARSRESEPVRILEIGFGTGLNAWLTYVCCTKRKIPTLYEAVEAYPLDIAEVQHLNYVNHSEDEKFLRFHRAAWEQLHGYGDYFRLKKTKQRIENLKLSGSFDVIYYDAFGPRVQPELWTASVFAKMHELLASRGLLVTYCAKGSVKRMLKAVGFSVEGLPGPPGKREMTRAKKD